MGVLILQEFLKMRCPKMTQGWLDDCCDLPNTLLLSHGDYLSSKRFLDEKYCVLKKGIQTKGNLPKSFLRFRCIVIWWYWNAFLSCFYLGTLWFSAKIFSCDNSSGKKMSWSYFNVSKTQQRHSVPALFLHVPRFLSYLQHCPKTENWLMIKHY